MIFFDWLKKGKKKESGIPLPEQSLLVTPGTYALVPQVLSVTVEEHDLAVEPNPTVPLPRFPLPGGRCRSYLTRGLAATGQAEVMFVLAPSGSVFEARFESDVLQLFNLLYTLAQEGRTVEAGDRSLFGDQGLFGLSRCGIAYLEPADGPGPAVPKDVLLALLLRQDEWAAAEGAGLRRAVAWLGHAYRMFPYPKFSDPLRPTAVPPGLGPTILSTLPCLAAATQATAFLHDKILTLRLTSAGPLLEELRAAFAATEHKPCFVILTGGVPRADARFVWLPNVDAPQAIGPAGSTLSVIEGGFIALVGAQPQDHALVVEDGFSAMLGTDSWLALRQAVASKTALRLPMAGDEQRFVSELQIEFA